MIISIKSELENKRKLASTKIGTVDRAWSKYCVRLNVSTIKDQQNLCLKLCTVFRSRRHKITNFHSNALLNRMRLNQNEENKNSSCSFPI